MRIANHRLVDHWFDQSKDVGGKLKSLRFIVMHYTAGGSGAGSRDYMMLSPKEKQARLGREKLVYASAHLVVDRDGSIWQIVPFDRKARHAGVSNWKNLTSLNQYSVGIEIANYGWLNRQGDGSYKRPETPRFAAEDVMVGPMPNGTEIKGWENYPDAQLEAVERVTGALLDKYPSITEIVGHQEIAPGRKFDPGPAFPLQQFRNLVDSRGIGAVDTLPNAGEPAPEQYETMTRVNIRGGPGTEFEKLDESPLAVGTRVAKQDQDGVWCQVSLDASPGVQGWVHSRYLRLV